MTTESRSRSRLQQGAIMIDELEYQHHLRRERQERALADAASDPAVAAVHLEMAKRHAALAEEEAPKRRIG